MNSNGFTSPNTNSSGFGFGSPTPSLPTTTPNPPHPQTPLSFGSSQNVLQTSLSNSNSNSQIASSQSSFQNYTTGFGASSHSHHNTSTPLSGFGSNPTPSLSGFGSGSGSINTAVANRSPHFASSGMNPFSANTNTNSNSNTATTSNRNTPIGFDNNSSSFATPSNFGSTATSTTNTTLTSGFGSTNNTGTPINNTSSGFGDVFQNTNISTSGGGFGGTFATNASTGLGSTTSNNSNTGFGNTSATNTSAGFGSTSLNNTSSGFGNTLSNNTSSGFGNTSASNSASMGFGSTPATPNSSGFGNNTNTTKFSSSTLNSSKNTSSSDTKTGFGITSSSTSISNPFLASSSDQNVSFGSSSQSKQDVPSFNATGPFSSNTNSNASWKEPVSFSSTSTQPFSNAQNAMNPATSIASFTPAPSSTNDNNTGETAKLSKLNAQIEEKKKKLLERLQAKKLLKQSTEQQKKASEGTTKAETNQPQTLAERNALRFSADTSSNATSIQDLPPELQALASQPPIPVSKPAETSTTVSGTEEQTDQDANTSLIGTCTHMCPDEELLRRQKENDIQLLELLSEKIHPSHWTLRNTAVKRFRRSAADFKLDIPELVRTPFLLEQTCAYLEEWVMERDRQGIDPRFVASQVVTSDTPSPMDVYQFIWDRTRMIRKDFILQNYQANGTVGGKCSAVSVRVHERIARWHAMMEHQLSHISDFVDFHSQQNIQELGQTMKTLNLYYDDTLNRSIVEEENSAQQPCHGCQNEGIQGPTPTDFDGTVLNGDHSHTRILGKKDLKGIHNGTAEPEMRALYILLTMDNDGGMEVLKYAGALCVENPMVYKSKPVQLALSVYKAKKEENYARFFSILKSPKTPYLFACVMFKHVEQMRKLAFQRMYRIFGARSSDGNAKYDEYPLKDLVNLLCFEDEREAYQACKHYNIKVKKLSHANSNEYQHMVLWKHSQYREATDPEKGTALRLVPKKMIRTVERKVCGSTRLAVCRGDLSGEGTTLSQPAVRRLGSVSLPSPTKATLFSATSSLPSNVNITLAQGVIGGNASQAESEIEKFQRAQILEQTKKQEEAEKLVEAKRREAERKAREEWLKKEKARIAEEQRLAKLAAEKERQRKEEERKRLKREAEQKRLQLLEVQRKRDEEERLRREKEAELKRQKEAKEKAERDEKERQRKMMEAEERQRRLIVKQRAEKERKIAEEKEKLRLLEMARVKAQQIKEEQERQRRLAREEKERKEREAKRRRELLRNFAVTLASKTNLAQKRRVLHRLIEFINCPETRRQNVRRSLSLIDSTFTSLVNFHSHPVKTHKIISHDQDDKIKEELFYRLCDTTQKLNLSHILGNSILQNLLQKGMYSTESNVIYPATTEEYLNRHVILCKVAVILPETVSNENGIHESVSLWIHSLLSCGKIQVEKFIHNEELYEIRTIAVDGSNNASKVSGSDAVLFVIPPKAKTNEVVTKVPRFPQSSVNEIHSEMIRMALVLDDEYKKPEILSAERDLFNLLGGGTNHDIKDQKHIAVVSAEPENSSTISKAFQSCLRVLLHRFVGGMFQKEQFKPYSLRRVNLLDLCRKCMLRGLRQLQLKSSSKVSHRIANEKSILDLIKSIPLFLSKELNKIGNNIMKESIALWPAEEFSISTNNETYGANVPNYFFEGSNLPLYWLSLLTNPNLDKEIIGVLNLQNSPSSMQELLANMLSGSPISIKQKCEILLEENRFIQCMESVLLWLEDKEHMIKASQIHTSFASIIYLPFSVQIVDVVDKVIQEKFGRNTIDEQRSNSAALFCLDMERGSFIPMEDPNVRIRNMDPQSKKQTNRKRQPNPDERRMDCTKNIIDTAMETNDIRTPQRKRMKVGNRVRKVFTKQKKESSEFTLQLEALLNGGTTIDMKIGGTELNKILSSSASSIKVPGIDF